MATRRDLTIELVLDSASSDFAVEMVSLVEHTDEATNRVFSEKEVSRLEYADLTPTQQTNGKALITALRGRRNTRHPLVRPQPLP